MPAPANAARGEVALTIDGVPRRMRLTLGALAELEGALQTPSLIALAERFENGSVAATDLIALLSAGLRGAGEAVSTEELARAEIAGGAVGALEAGLALLAAAFRADP
ncbi:MAG: gene transfer agent family protein [Pikeienuella sp.]